MSHNPNDFDYDALQFDPNERLFPKQHPGPDIDPDRDHDLDPDSVPQLDPDPYPLEESEFHDLNFPDRYWHPDDGMRRFPRPRRRGLVTISEAATITQIGESTLYRYVRQGRLRYSVVSRNPLRFHWGKLLKELQDCSWRE